MAALRRASKMPRSDARVIVLRGPGFERMPNREVASWVSKTTMAGAKAPCWIDVGACPHAWADVPESRRRPPGQMGTSAPRSAFGRPGWLPAWIHMEDHPKVPTCPCYPDRAPAREGPGMKCSRCHQD